MKVLVTGGAGFIGSHVVEAYAAAGHEVVVIDDLSTGSAANLSEGVRFHRLDIGSPRLAEVIAAERPDVVNHHAAQISVNFSVREPRHDAETNILGSLNVIACCQQYGVKKLIYISSGGATVGEPRYLPVDEQHPVDPLSPYGASKHTVEHYLFLSRKLTGLDYTVLRYPNVFGPRQDPLGEAGVVAIFVGQMLRRAPVRINGTGEQERDYIHVSDLARVNLLALGAPAGEIYNTGTGVGTTVNEIFRVLANCTGYDLDPLHGPPLPGEVFKIYLDSGKVARDLGWQPSISLSDGLRQTVDWFQRRADVGS